jgi:hypothetical protein
MVIEIIIGIVWHGSSGRKVCIVSLSRVSLLDENHNLFKSFRLGLVDKDHQTFRHTKSSA